MATERSLLERLSRPRAAAARTMSENTPELVRSVLRNLQRILNSRQGHAAAQMDLGMPAPCEITQAFPDALAWMLRGIRACIEKYEPRIQVVDIARVESEEDALTLRFQITARVAAMKGGPTVSFDTVVDPTGRIRLHG